MVATTDGKWQTMSDLWISDGVEDCQGKIEIRVWLSDGVADEEQLATSTRKFK